MDQGWALQCAGEEQLHNLLGIHVQHGKLWSQRDFKVPTADRSLNDFLDLMLTSTGSWFSTGWLTALWLVQEALRRTSSSIQLEHNVLRTVFGNKNNLIKYFSCYIHLNRCLAPTYLGAFDLPGKQLREKGINRYVKQENKLKTNGNDHHKICQTKRNVNIWSSWSGLETCWCRTTTM